MIHLRDMKNFAIGYGRVSTEEQKEEGMSLQDQEEKIKAYCTLWKLDVQKIISEDISGYKYLLKDRPGGKEILDAVHTKSVQHVVCCKLDRMFRDAGDALVVSRKWQQNGITLHFIDMGGQSIDTSSASGRFYFTILAGAAELERNRISERTKDALAYRKEHNLVYGPVPFGFRREGKQLIEIPDEQKVLQQIRAWRERKLSFWKIADKLNEQGVPTKQGGKRWYASSVRSVHNC